MKKCFGYGKISPLRYLTRSFWPRYYPDVLVDSVEVHHVSTLSTFLRLSGGMPYHLLGLCICIREQMEVKLSLFVLALKTTAL